MTFLERLDAARQERAREYVELTKASPKEDSEAKRSDRRGAGDECGVAGALVEYLEVLDEAGWEECRSIEKRALEVFAGLARDPSEHEHEQHGLWREFVASLERALAGFAASRGRSVVDIFDEVRRALRDGDADASDLVAAIGEATDYVSWARDMRRCAALRSYAIDAEGLSSAQWGPDRGYCNLRRRSFSSDDDSPK